MSAAHASSIPMTREERINQRNAVLAGFLGWTLDAFDFFILTLIIDDVAKAFGKTRPDIALALTLTLAMRPIGAVVFGIMADRLGRRLPLMLNVIFYALLSVLSGLAPSYQVFLVLRMLFGVCMGGEWGVGASLALESASPRLRGLLSGLLQEGYAMGNLLSALAFRLLYPTFNSMYPGNGWRMMFFLGGLPALLSLFIRSRVKESAAWHEHKTDWSTYRRSLPQVLEALRLSRPPDDDDEFHVAWNAGHVSDDARHDWVRSRAHRRRHDAVGDRRRSRRARLRFLLGQGRPASLDDDRDRLQPPRRAVLDRRAQPGPHPVWRVPDAVLRAGRVGRDSGAHQRAVAKPSPGFLPGPCIPAWRDVRGEHPVRGVGARRAVHVHAGDGRTRQRRVHLRVLRDAAGAGSARREFQEVSRL